MDKIILIGGAPTTGKSTLAQKLSEELKLLWISTDIIRSIMQKTVKKSDYPKLFYPAQAEAKDYLEKSAPEQIVADQNAESEAVWCGVEAAIKDQDTWEGKIIEGVAVLPYLVNALKAEVPSISSFFIYEDREDRIREVIFKRGLWDSADKYSDTLKEKEVQWVILFNEFIKAEAAKYNFPLIKYQDDGSHVKEILELLK